MALINCKIELKLQWIKHCVLAATVLSNVDTNSNNIIFDIKDTKLCFPVITSTKTIKNCRNFSAKDLKEQCIGMNIKQKVRIKIQQMNIDIFPN